MLANIIGLILAVIGLCISLFYEKLIKLILKKEHITDADVVRVKCTALGIAILGLAVSMLF